MLGFKGNGGSNPYMVCGKCGGWVFDWKLPSQDFKCKKCSARLKPRTGSGSKGKDAGSPQTPPDKTNERIHSNLLKEDYDMAAAKLADMGVDKVLEILGPPPAATPVQAESVPFLLRRDSQRAISADEELKRAVAYEWTCRQKLAEASKMVQEASDKAEAAHKALQRAKEMDSKKPDDLLGSPAVGAVRTDVDDFVEIVVLSAVILSSLKFHYFFISSEM